MVRAESSSSRYTWERISGTEKAYMATEYAMTPTTLAMRMRRNMADENIGRAPCVHWARNVRLVCAL